MAISSKYDRAFDYCARGQLKRHFLPTNHDSYRSTIRQLLPNIKKIHASYNEIIFNVKLVQSELLRALYA